MPKGKKKVYRMRTARRLMAELEEKGDMTISQLAKASGREVQVVRRYLNYFPGLFQQREGKTLHGEKYWGIGSASQK